MRKWEPHERLGFRLSVTNRTMVRRTRVDSISGHVHHTIAGVLHELARDPRTAPAGRQAASNAGGSAAKKVRFDPVVAQIPEGGSAIRIGQGRARSNAVIAPPPKVVSAKEFQRADGKKLEVVKKANGKIAYTAPPAKVGEVTFSGGGGKGTALPGAVKALYESGVLKDATKIAGASVGSMTAALVAAGITPKEFLEVADADRPPTRSPKAPAAPRRACWRGR